MAALPRVMELALPSKDVKCQVPSFLHSLALLCWLQDSPENHFDCIIVDSSDPVGPAEVLFERASVMS